jgi:VanZ family protein
LFYSALIVVFYLALAPQEAVLVTTGWDKANHYIAFVTLLALFDHAYPTRSIWAVKLPCLIFYAVLIELVQATIPDRDASLLDLLADGLGLFGYMLIRPWVIKIIPSIFVDKAS